MYYYTNSGKGRSRAYDIFQELETISKDVASKLKEHFEKIDPPAAMAHIQRQFRPAIDLTEDEGNLYVRAEIPGITKEDIQLVMRGTGGLEISGVKTSILPESEREVVRGERRYGKFSRTVDLPQGVEVDASAITAKYVDGVLTVTIPKKEQGEKGFTINVQ